MARLLKPARCVSGCGHQRAGWSPVGAVLVVRASQTRTCGAQRDLPGQQGKKLQFRTGGRRSAAEAECGEVECWVDSVPDAAAEMGACECAEFSGAVGDNGYVPCGEAGSERECRSVA